MLKNKNGVGAAAISRAIVKTSVMLQEFSIFSEEAHNVFGIKYTRAIRRDNFRDLQD